MEQETRGATKYMDIICEQLKADNIMKLKVNKNRDLWKLEGAQRTHTWKAENLMKVKVKHYGQNTLV